jgi:hypothetical protein
VRKLKENKQECVILETTGTGNVFPVGSIVDLKGELVFWRDVVPTKFLFRKGNYEAIFQDEVLIDFIETTPVKTMIFHKGNGEIWKTGVDTFSNAKVVNMRGRRQKGVSLLRFNEEKLNELPTNRRPETKVVIGGMVA